MHETTRPHHFTDNKLTGGQRTIRDINSELAKLQSSYSSAVLRRDEATKALAMEISNQQFEKWQTEHLTKRQKDYKQQFEKIRADIAALKSHMPMIGENFILSIKIVSSLFNCKIPVIQSTKKKKNNNVFSSCLLLTEEGCRRCLPGWTFMNSVCYYFPLSDNISQRPWLQARQFCTRHGADLAVVDTSAKHVRSNINLTCDSF